jgi:hypothetical protein
LNLKREAHETEIQFGWRLYTYVKNGQLTWQELADLMNRDCRTDESEYRTESAYRKPLQGAQKYYDEIFSKMTSDNDILCDIEAERRELDKARKKLQTEKIEYNRWLREEAREEMIFEKIRESISQLTPISVPKLRERDISTDNPDERGAVLCLADAHFNTEFEIRGLFGEIINSYSPEIFYQRMWYLRDKLQEICKREELSKLYIFGLGDDNDGLLRLTDNLFKLRWGVIDSTIVYAEFMANWLNEVSKFVNIELQIVEDSNHNQLRLCSAPKNAFKDENLSKIIIHIIKCRLQGNPRITVVQNPTGYVYAKVAGYNLLGIHGETKSLKLAIDDLSRLYKTQIQYVIGGHNHHSEEFGSDCEGISVGSIIGIDDYSASIMRSSNASSTMLIFEKDRGLVTKHTIKLN